MTEKQKGMPLIDEQSKMSIERLQKIIDETQETIRAYDIKAEILAIILTLVIGVINFTLVNNFNSVGCIKYTALITITIGVISLLCCIRKKMYLRIFKLTITSRNEHIS